MRIHDTDYAALAAAVQPHDKPEHRGRYQAGNFPRADRCKDKDKRYRWDLLYLSGFQLGPLYSYLNDEHIDTALRRIVPPL